MKTDFFQGKVCVVTGAGGGIGRALVEGLLRRGAVVAAWDVNEIALAALVAEARKFHWDLITAVVDVTDPVAVRRGRDQLIAERQRIDVWVNNAGIVSIKSFGQSTAEEYDRIFAVNLGGVVDGTRAALERMETQGSGLVVNIASVAGFIPAAYLSAYSAAKHGVVGFTGALQEELRLQNSPLRVALVSPGFVDTPMIALGEKHGFPPWLSWILSTPTNVSDEILEGLRRGRLRLFPTWNGRLMLRVYRLFPRATARSTRLLLLRRFRDLFLNRYTVD